jgi:ubiquinone biosynthesis protein Coq4
MLQTEEGRNILEEKPRITPENTNLQDMAENYPEASFGRAYSKWML